MTQIKNFTPHPISICNNAGEVTREIQSEGLVRLKVVTVPAGEIDGVPVTRTQFGEPEGLPEQVFTALAGGNAGYGESIEAAEWSLYKDYNLEPEWSGIETYYVVSQLVKSALPNRVDLLVPAEVVRNSDGNVIGCRSLGL
jgi:hypothetical protein